MSAARVAVLLAAGAADWERTALEVLDRPGGRVVLLKRCLDLSDLLATAATGAAHVAVVAEGLPGLDADSVERLARHGVRLAVVAGAGAGGGAGAGAGAERLARLGASLVLDPAAVPDLAARLLAAATQAPPPVAADASRPDVPVAPASARGRLVAVWGPHGSPGRTTVAVALASVAAAGAASPTHPATRTLLVDADPYGGAVAQQLALVEEVSGLLAAARSANAGELDVARLARLARQVAPGLRVLTGLPRPDRWTEVRPQAFRELLEVARSLDDLVVVDCGPGLPDAEAELFADAPQRDAMTAAALEAADVVVVVGGADPVALPRLARSLPDLLAAAPGAKVRLLVNRVRGSVGWSHADMRALLAEVAPGTPVAFVAEDRAAADRALIEGRSLVDGRDSALRAGLREAALEVLADLGLVPTAGQGSAGARRWRRARPAPGKRAARRPRTMGSHRDQARA